MINKPISHYKILEKLGEGGMGEVYLAEDQKLNRKVVLKFLSQSLEHNETARERFQREAQAIAALNHPNVITIYENGKHRGRNYIVTEFVDGETLGERIKQTKDLPADEQKFREIINFAIQICKGLQKAHQVDIIHRDIKPGNILIDHDSQVKIMDFGLAKQLGTGKLTEDEYVVGTGYYMSPEQVGGKKVTRQTDIWSFGVVLYEMICGALPFSGKYFHTLFNAILNEKPRSLEEQCPEVPADLVMVVSRCLKKDLKKRYQDISQVLEHLDLLKHKYDSGTDTIKIKKISRTYSLIREKPWIVTPTIVLISLLLLIFISSPLRQTIKNLVTTNQIPLKKHLVLLPATVTGTSTYRILCEGFIKNLGDKLIQLEKYRQDFWIIPPGQTRKKNISTIMEARHTYGITLAVELKFKVVPQGIKKKIDLNLSLINAHSKQRLKPINFENITSNLSLFQEGILTRLVQMLKLDLNPQELESLFYGETALPGAYEFYLRGLGYMMAYDAVDGGASEEKKNLLSMAINQFERASDQDPSYRLAWSQLGLACQEMYLLTKEENWARDGESYCRRAVTGEKIPPLAYFNLGMIYKQAGHHQAAIKELSQAILLNQEYYEAQTELAKVFEAANKFKEAEEAYKRAVEMRPDFQGSYHHLGYFYFSKGRSQEATQNFRLAAGLTPENVDFYNNLIPMYYYLGQMELAEEMFAKSIAIRSTGVAYQNMATILFFEKEYAKALKHFEMAVKLKSEDYVNWGNLGDCYQAVPGYAEKAPQAFREAIRLLKKELEKQPRDESVAEKLSELAIYYAKTGNYQQALTEISTSLKLLPKNLFIIKDAVLVYELAGQRDKALVTLKEYIERQGPMEEIENDPSLADLRSDPRYHQLIGGEGIQKGKNKN